MSIKLERQIDNFLMENESKRGILHPPFDVGLPEEDENEEKDISTTVVPPDILVVCDTDKLDHKGMKHSSPDRTQRGMIISRVRKAHRDAPLWF